MEYISRCERRIQIWVKFYLSRWWRRGGGGDVRWRNSVDGQHGSASGLCELLWSAKRGKVVNDRKLKWCFFCCSMRLVLVMWQRRRSNKKPAPCWISAEEEGDLQVDNKGNGTTIIAFENNAIFNTFIYLFKVEIDNFTPPSISMLLELWSSRHQQHGY